MSIILKEKEENRKWIKNNTKTSSQRSWQKQSLINAKLIIRSQIFMRTDLITVLRCFSFVFAKNIFSCSQVVFAVSSRFSAFAKCFNKYQWFLKIRVGSHEVNRREIFSECLAKLMYEVAFDEKINLNFFSWIFT